MNLSVFPNICGLRVECSHARRPNTLAPGSRCCFHARMFPWIFSECPGPSRAGWLSRGVHSSVLSQTGKRASGRCAVSRQDPQKPFQAPVPEPTDKGASAQSPGSPQASWVAFTNSLSSLFSKHLQARLKFSVTKGRASPGCLRSTYQSVPQRDSSSSYPGILFAPLPWFQYPDLSSSPYATLPFLLTEDNTSFRAGLSASGPLSLSLMLPLEKPLSLKTWEPTHFRTLHSQCLLTSPLFF